jgi:regulator of cell morphogenesis and NO signaling
MDISEKTIVGELVARDYRTASVFQSFGIDFCCKGGRPIDEACATKQVAAADVVSALQQAMRNPADNTPDFNAWPLDLLADYIEKTHHRYVERRTQEIMPFLQKVVRVHGDRHPELNDVERLFTASAGELAMHMKKEELVLFPYIRKMVAAGLSGDSVTTPAFGTVSNPIAMMHHEHDTEGERFRQIAGLTGDYTPPADACNTYRVTFALLKEFEEDLHRHIHLENNILFPKAVALESRLAATA